MVLPADFGPLNLEYILVNSFAGSMEIFFFIAAIAIAYMAARMRMPNIVTLMMGALFMVLMASLTGFTSLYLITILLVAIMFFFIVKKIWLT